MCMISMCECKPWLSEGSADETRETGEWKAVEGKTYYSIGASLSGNAFHQEAVCVSILVETYAD